MTRYPMRAAMAALRSLRQAAWTPTSPDEMILRVAALVEPMDRLDDSWRRLCGAVKAYEADRCSESLDVMHEALLDLDDTLGEFFGPSGWEPQTRGDGGKRKRPRSAHER